MPKHSPIPIQQGVAALQATRATRIMLCLALFLPASQAMGQQFGTLFTSPEEREYLDYLRAENLRLSQQNTFNIRDDVIPDIPVIAETTEEVAAPVISQYRFGGIMDRRNGSRMVWLNGDQVAENALPSNMRLVDTAGGTLLSISADNINYQLKPGQTYDVVAGRILESYQSINTSVNAAPTQALAPQASAESLPVPEAEPEAIDAPTQTAEGDEFTRILQMVNPDGGEFTEEQMQQALDMLSQQETAVE